MPVIDLENYRAAVNAALNKTLRSGATAARREIKRKYLAKRLTIPIKVGRSKKSTLEGYIRVKGAPLPLSLFSVTKRKKGLGVKVRRDRARFFVDQAFISDYLRIKTSKAYRRRIGQRLGKKRLPITQKSGPGAAEMFRKSGVEAVKKVMEAQMPIELTRALKARLPQR